MCHIPQARCRGSANFPFLVHWARKGWVPGYWTRGQWYRRACHLLPSLCWCQFILLVTETRCVQTTRPNALMIDHHATPEIDLRIKYILNPDLLHEITVLVRECHTDSGPDETCNYLLFRMRHGLWRITYAFSSSMLLFWDFLAPSVYTSLWGMYYWVKIIYCLINSSTYCFNSFIPFVLVSSRFNSLFSFNSSLHFSQSKI